MSTKTDKAKCYIFGAGDFTICEVPVTDEDYVIAVDGGLCYCGLLGIEPDLILGDFDSLSDEELLAVEKLKETIPERIVTLPCEKDDTDMFAAIKYAQDEGYRDFRIYGGMGGRFDHTFANVQCLLYLKNHNAKGFLVDGMGMMFVIQNESVHLCRKLEGTMSLFCLGEKAKGVSIRNMKYPLDGYDMRNDEPIGISNEFIGEECEISVEDGSLLCMITYS